MAIGLNTDTFFESPYLTAAEYQNAPTSIDFSNLVVGGNSAAQEAELSRVILRASSFLDEYLNQNLVATRKTETQRTRFMPNGFISLHPNQNPIIALESFSYGMAPNQLYTIPDPSLCWFESQQIIIPVSQMSLTWSSSGPLSFGGGGSNYNQIYCQYTYTSGYVNNPIAVAVAGASSMTVANPTGIVAGQALRIYDGAKSELVYVANNYTYGATTVALASPLLYDHAAGTTFGNLPNAIKEACILVTTAFIKMRGDSSMTMQVTVNPSGNITGAERYGSEIALALEMVSLYRRVR
jgi:hypothetical protein